jgi:hypothetical protein
MVKLLIVDQHTDATVEVCQNKDMAGNESSKGVFFYSLITLVTATRDSNPCLGVEMAPLH